MHPWFESIITFIYPAQCRCCEQFMGVGQIHYICDYCWEQIEITLDASGGEADYVEDCQVCCRPLVLRVGVEDDEAWATAEPES